MAGCESSAFLGRDTTLEFAIGCPDQLPEEGDWKFIGALRSNGISTEWDVVDSTADDSQGNIREQEATYRTITISADGVARRTDNAVVHQTELYLHYMNPTATGGQPKVWMRRTDPRVQQVGYFLLSTYDLEAPYDEISTFSIEATSTANSVIPGGVSTIPTPVV
jgi:predicted secreted protein